MERKARAPRTDWLLRYAAAGRTKRLRNEPRRGPRNLPAAPTSARGTGARIAVFHSFLKGHAAVLLELPLDAIAAARLFVIYFRLLATLEGALKVFALYVQGADFPVLAAVIRSCCDCPMSTQSLIATSSCALTHLHGLSKAASRQSSPRLFGASA